VSYVIEHPDFDGVEKVVPESALGTYADRGWVLTGRVNGQQPDAATKPLGLPARSASAAEWKTYAVVQGLPFDEAMAATRDDLADKYHPSTTPKATPVVKNPKES
jgi:hypothetical protein